MGVIFQKKRENALDDELKGLKKPLNKKRK